MKLNTKDMKKTLFEEFQWLQDECPLTSFQRIEFNIYDYKEYNRQYGFDHQDTYDEKETSAFIMESLSEDAVEYAIFMIISETFEPDETDKVIISRNNIEENQLVYWILYHEYGHLLDLNETYIKHGLKGLMKEKNDNEEELEQLWNLKNKGEVSQHEFEMQYRELTFEKKADEFADKIYKIRKNVL